jgi:hypothetical protein
MKTSPSEIDHAGTTWPICPTCGYEHQDAWEWIFGWELNPGLEGSGERKCYGCDEHFRVYRIVDVTYTTRKIDAC